MNGSEKLSSWLTRQDRVWSALQQIGKDGIYRGKGLTVCDFLLSPDSTFFSSSLPSVFPDVNHLGSTNRTENTLLYGKMGMFASSSSLTILSQDGLRNGIRKSNLSHHEVQSS